jgi:serine phosphatase RsbU (regulator of sigma subunit)
LFTVILILYSIRNNKRLKKRNNIIEAQSKDIHQKNNELELKNTEITDSINYAKRIQDAILPSKEDLIENLKNGFVIFKPKDIVSGDFYWLESLPLTPSPSERAGEGRIFFAAADCTGHGVPGAMVSVMCSNALSKALLEDNITDPGKILDRTRDLVIERFAKSKEDVKDGMDIALVSLEYSIRADSEEQKFLLKYAGANNPLWIIRNLESPTSGFELIELKPNKQPVGKSFKTEPFDTHTIELKKGDSIYLLTDGYPDQFGGEKGKKLKKAPLKEILLSIQHLTMDEQKTHLENFFEQWKGDLQQVDDVCVIGVKI